MTKVLLINTNQFQRPWPAIPFGLCCVASMLQAHGRDVQVLDLCFSKSPAKDMTQSLKRFQPDVVGVGIRNLDSCAAYQARFFIETIRKTMITPLKQMFSGPILIGGASVGISGEEMLAYFDLEYAVRGDGEETIMKVIERFETGQSFSGIGGLIIRKEGRIVETNPPLPVCDLNSLPFPNPAAFLDLAPYRQFKTPLQIQTKRGCPLHCSYCTYNRIEGQQYRLKDPQRIGNEIDYLVESTGIRELEFVDSTFNLPLPHAKAVLRELINRKLKLNLSTMGLNPAGIDAELVDLMKKVGFEEVHLGIESASDVTLKELGKTYNKQKVIQSIRLLQKAKIPIKVDLLLGSPAETKDTFRETMQTVLREVSPWNMIDSCVGIRVYKGSPISQKLKQTQPHLARDNFFYPVTDPPKDISLQQIQESLAQIARSHPNVFQYNTDADSFPVWLVKVAYAFIRLFRLKVPIWRTGIALRRLGLFAKTGRFGSMELPEETFRLPKEKKGRKRVKREATSLPSKRTTQPVSNSEPPKNVR